MGVGNPQRGDDGIGCRVVQSLAQADRLPAGVELVDGGTQGLGLVNQLLDRRRAVLIDAADLGREPGAFCRLTIDELAGPSPFNVHAAGLRDALLLARALGRLPEEVVILGVQPATLAWDSGLSPQVEAALPDLLAAVWSEITRSGRTAVRPYGVEGEKCDQDPDD
jgi:hydrogenase maturation protease